MYFFSQRTPRGSLERMMRAVPRLALQQGGNAASGQAEAGNIETIQGIIRALRDAGAFVNNSCGIHIHVNAASFTAPKLRNQVNIMAAKEDMIYRALQVDRDREHHYCRNSILRNRQSRRRTAPPALRCPCRGGCPHPPFWDFSE